MPAKASGQVHRGVFFAGKPGSYKATSTVRRSEACPRRRPTRYTAALSSPASLAPTEAAPPFVGARLAREGVRPGTPRRLLRRQAWLLQKQRPPSVGARLAREGVRPGTPRRPLRRQAWLLQKQHPPSVGARLARESVRPDTPRRLLRRQAWLLQKQHPPCVGARLAREGVSAVRYGRSSVAPFPGRGTR
ncbi:hypothetical protein SAMN03159453_01657 [Pseudomonas sp. NFIX28]|nr:hypothetical protein SAMN03159453_01657 [Pseudomonas sp. NFIX28]